jgi:large subunit ribosomal protein L3
VKTVDSDGYNAVQLGFKDMKAKLSRFPLIGHAGKAGVGPKRHFREIRLKDATTLAPGAQVDVDLFNEVQYVDVIGTSKGKGTAGVMKRHHFGGQCASHGTERKHRSPGSIASRATWRGQSGKPKKGLRMAGHMGMDQVTTRNHPLVKIDKENHLLLIKGALPGPNGGLLFVRKSITARVKAAEEAQS